MSDFIITRDNGSQELLHYGIKGQKWGERNYQYEDGTLTPAGKERYRNNSDMVFARNRILSELSNVPKIINKKTVIISEVQKRSGLNYKDSMECSKIANKLFDKAANEEPQITKDVIKAVSNRTKADMHGLENRLKQPTSIAGKIGADSIDKGISFEDASLKINDIIRYTAISDDKEFVSNYNSIKKNLESNGYKEIKCKNYFTLYDSGLSMHKSVQSIYESPNGQKFEIQFQTPFSQAAKELKLPIYEERRLSDISDQRVKELESEMRKLADQVPNPPKIKTIK